MSLDIYFFLEIPNYRIVLGITVTIEKQVNNLSTKINILCIIIKNGIGIINISF